MKRKALILVLHLLTFYVLFFIFSHSLQSRAASQSLSLSVTSYIKPFLGFFIGEERVSDPLVRKIAHFVEFAALGFLMTLLYKICQRIVKSTLWLSGLLCCLFDETVQLFSARGSLVSDVWLDFSGFMLAYLFVELCFLIGSSHNVQKK